MSIKFAAPSAKLRPRMSADRVRAIRPVHDNDNGDLVGETHMHAALRHFAKYGLNAAQHAREQAIAAARNGDRRTFEWWLEICRALDRPMARKLDRATKNAS
ncbi:hypothetical protein [Aurantiacibacter sp. D1-12]|uniref:hypothetical protein n=1 Tax=Aurantiacibacter sp. D1-12 TaxID=2993658 RepID=UPI00237CB7A9|nr:hypothetical protein [Aurantiacibacter sp. D1-12]MDE1468022.1 hypothetical protein [Aurantiacibacter sp. D1-12]